MRVPKENDEGSMMKTYKGIEIENTDKVVRMAHSRFFERDKGVDCLTELLGMEKAGLTPEQFRAMSALSSVANMNYQICNGGLEQYYFNGYDCERAPFNAEDVNQLDKEAQVEMLCELLAFGKAVFPERELDGEDDEDSGYYEEEGGLCAPWGFDERYYKVNDYLEALIEAYAQYLMKSFA